MFIAVTGFDLGALRRRRDGPKHRSVNAGWPEAAMAHRLGLALSGPRSYAAR
jgi:cobalamin biosynthesis protein CobD/CbiB